MSFYDRSIVRSEVGGVWQSVIKTSRYTLVPLNSLLQITIYFYFMSFLLCTSLAGIFLHSARPT